MTSTTTPGRRERKARRTRQLILDAAWLLFTRDGVAQTSVAAIAEVAEVSEVTLYNHFGSRQCLIDEVMSEHGSMDRAVAAIRARPEGEGPIEAMRAIHRGQAELSDDEFRRQVKIVRMINEDPLMRGAYRRQLGAYVEQLVDALRPRAERVGMPRHQLALFCFAFGGIVDALSEDERALASAKAWAEATDAALVLLATGWGDSR
jgi:AcrR family transcriptional regulator